MLCNCPNKYTGIINTDPKISYSTAGQVATVYCWDGRALAALPRVHNVSNTGTSNAVVSGIWCVYSLENTIIVCGGLKVISH